MPGHHAVVLHIEAGADDLAARLRACVRASDTVTPRAGGGFAVALMGATPSDAAKVAARLAAALGTAVRTVSAQGEEAVAAG